MNQVSGYLCEGGKPEKVHGAIMWFSFSSSCKIMKLSTSLISKVCTYIPRPESSAQWGHNSSLVFFFIQNFVVRSSYGKCYIGFAYLSYMALTEHPTKQAKMCSGKCTYGKKKE
jgi:hypothetical protein